MSDTEKRKALAAPADDEFAELGRSGTVWRALLGAAWVSVLVCACAMVWARHEARQQFQALQELQRERDELNIEWSQLRLELGALAAHSRVERLAREQLSMREPVTSEMRIVRDDEE
ncbi:MAG: cell division protein FtsL [Pseudomonadota bacterium]